MNNQIRELAEQAGFYFYDMHNVDGQDLGETVEADSWRVPEAFAKLIVRECMRMCDVAAIGYHTHGHIKEANGCASAKEYIADWFEVE